MFEPGVYESNTEQELSEDLSDDEDFPEDNSTQPQVE